MKHLPIIAFLVVAFEIFTNVFHHFLQGDASISGLFVALTVAAMLSWVAARIVYSYTKKAVVIYRLLRLKVSQRLRNG